jgi:hypothetical protein
LVSFCHYSKKGITAIIIYLLPLYLLRKLSLSKKDKKTEISFCEEIGTFVQVNLKTDNVHKSFMASKSQKGAI